jgi:linoleoyl-CoA desaturase
MMTTPQTDRYRRLGQELDALKARIQLQLGDKDVAHMKKVQRVSNAAEVVGRTLLHVSMDPITWTAGVAALWLHKQLEATEIGHTALHGAFDKLEGGEQWKSEGFHWDVPIDEESWRSGHNHKHHGNTNIAGKDPDIHFGPIRLTQQTPHEPAHERQPWWLLVVVPTFGFGMNLHFSGVADLLQGDDKPLDVLPDRSLASRKKAWKAALRKYVPYYAKNFGFYPALAGPMFWKVLLGNIVAEVARDVYSAATIYCGHVGGDVSSWPEGTKAQSRGQWYAMQIEATNNYEVPRWVSILCGGLDRQIEHHLFPTLPPERLREIAPEVKAICERHGIAYKTDTWGNQIKKAFAHIKRLSRDEGPRAVLREAA